MKQPQLSKYMQLLTKIGVGVLVSILTGFLVGLWVDRRFQLNGVGVLVGVLVGVVIGFVWLYKEGMGFNDDDL